MAAPKRYALDDGERETNGLLPDVAMPTCMSKPRERKLPLLLGAAAALLTVAGAMPEERKVRAVATVAQLMQAMVIPASNALFNLPRNVPEDDQGWSEVQHSAVILAESGNLLMIGSRARDSEVWMATSKALVEAGEAALKAVEARDVDAFADIGNQIIEACESCHEKHWIR